MTDDNADKPQGEALTEESALYRTDDVAGPAEPRSQVVTVDRLMHLELECAWLQGELHSQAQVRKNLERQLFELGNLHTKADEERSKALARFAEHRGARIGVQCEKCLHRFDVALPRRSWWRRVVDLFRGLDTHARDVS